MVLVLVMVMLVMGEGLRVGNRGEVGVGDGLAS